MQAAERELIINEHCVIIFLTDGAASDSVASDGTDPKLTASKRVSRMIENNNNLKFYIIKFGDSPWSEWWNGNGLQVIAKAANTNIERSVNGIQLEAYFRVIAKELQTASLLAMESN